MARATPSNKIFRVYLHDIYQRRLSLNYMLIDGLWDTAQENQFSTWIAKYYEWNRFVDLKQPRSVLQTALLVHI